MYCYQVYGLTIYSELPLEGVLPATVPSPDTGQVSVRYGQSFFNDQQARGFYTDKTRCPNNEKALVIETDGDFFRWRYCDGIEYFISADGRQIWINHPPEENEQTLAFYLVGPILGFALRLQGQICLHASVVCIDGSAVAFLGGSGAGKSTFAAALAKHRGCNVLSDDLAVLSVCNNTIFVAPGYARLRLWPDASQALFGEAGVLPRLIEYCALWPDWDKQYLALKSDAGEFETQPQPLAAVYILAERGTPEVSIAALSGHKAVLQLLANVYQGYLSDARRSAQELALLTRLAKQVPIRQLNRPDAIEHLAMLCELVVQDLNTQMRRAC